MPSLRAAAPDRPRRGAGILEQLASLISPGPFAWILKTYPLRPHFHAGPHLHGLDDHDRGRSAGAPTRRWRA